MTMALYSIRIIGNACILKYDAGEGQDVKTILETYYPRVDEEGKLLVKDYVASVRPDIPYETSV